MRIVIVEDEVKTREGLIKVIKRFTDHEICGIATNGIEGLRVIEEKEPDLIISDVRMPEMDGLTMLRQLAEKEGKAHYALVLTGYSSFDYAREALQLGVLDYILKPLDIENFLEVLKKTETRIMRDREKKVTVERLMWELLSGSGQLSEQGMKALYEGLQCRGSERVDLFLIEPGSIDQETAGEIMQRTREKLEELQILNAHVIRLSYLEGILVMIIDTDRQRTIDKMFAQSILPELQKLGNVYCSHMLLESLDEIKRAVEELKELLSYSFVYGSGVVLNRELVEQLEFEDLQYPVDLENRIQKEMLNGDYEGAKKSSIRFREKVIEKNGNPELIREYTARFLSNVYNMAQEQDESKEPILIFHYFINNIIESRTKDELLENYDKVMKSLLVVENEPEDVDDNIVLKVINFIRNNYDQNITLSDAAELVGVTPEYLSKLFAQKTNINFVAFLRNFRISIAKRMILSGQYRIADVATQVGFHDPKYFNKVFKSVCGVSPSEYKKVSK